MESLVNLQLDIKKNIEKGRINYKKSPKDRITLAYLETRLETLEQQWLKFVDKHESIVTNIDPKHEYFTGEIYDKTEDMYIAYKSELKESIKQLASTKLPTPEQPTTCKAINVKLPKIVIPTFTGKYTEWTTFRDLFLSLIHKDDTIDDVQKLHYLKGHLSGEPEQLLRHTPVTAANYQECWQLLSKRYDNKRYLSNCILKRLMNQPNVIESSTAVKELLDTTVDCLHGLSSLGINVDSWDVITIFIVSAKLDSESRKLWESRISTLDELPTFDKFKDFLESRFRALEYLDTSNSRPRSTVDKPRALHVVDSNSIKNTLYVSCPLCKENHTLSHCKQFRMRDVKARSEFVRNHKLCFNCLGSNHVIKFCNVKTLCQVCHRKHHSLLHQTVSTQSASPSSSGQPAEAVAAQPAKSVNQAVSGTAQQSGTHTASSHFSHKLVPGRVLLATALVEAQARSGYKQLLRALLDQGSQTSFITESAVQLLGLKKIPARSFISGVGGDERAFASRFIVEFTIQSRHDPSFTMQVQACVLRNITSLIPSSRVSLPPWPELGEIILADPEYHTPNKIDVLLGAEVYGQVLKEGLVKCGPGSIIAQDTTLGWILSGRTHTDHDLDSANCHSRSISLFSHSNDDDLLKRFWEIESDITSTKKRLTPEEQQCEEFFSRTRQRDNTGRYIVKLPFREIDVEKKIGSTRKHGPTWLAKETIDYTKPRSITTDLERKSSNKNVKAHVVTNRDSFWTKFSSLQKLIRVVAYCKRFLKYKQKPKEPYLTSSELKEALEVCIKHCQEQEFKEEIESLKESKLRLLCPIIDEQGILRVGGRIEKSQFSDSMKHPIIIPHNYHFSTLLVREAHQNTLHGGPTLMLNYLRSKYWLISAKNLVKACVRKCVTCIRQSADFKNQFMGQLPTCRVTPTRPFLHTGVDFAGPIDLRTSKGRGNKSYKGYICLFVCMSTRAVHLEAISDLTSQGFLAGFKRFVARRCYCSDIWSDNGKNFVGASKELQSLVAAEKSAVAGEIRGWLASKGVNWHFIPPHAPNFGGLWEAGIKSTKFHLKRVIGNSTLTYEEMGTLLAQIEACLNSRPMSQISQDPNEPTPLTPGHFIIGEPLILVPERNYQLGNINTLKRWQLLQKMTQDFWRRWSQEFMAYMLQRYKWCKREPEPKIGEIVLVKEDNLPPGKWLLGIVKEKHPGSDGITRVVTLKCNDSLIKRPTSKLCILPVAE